MVLRAEKAKDGRDQTKIELASARVGTMVQRKSQLTRREPIWECDKAEARLGSASWGRDVTRVRVDKTGDLDLPSLSELDWSEVGRTLVETVDLISSMGRVVEVGLAGVCMGVPMILTHWR